MEINLTDELKEFFSAIVENGSIFLTYPLSSIETDQMKDNGILIEECLPNGFRYRISNDFRQYLNNNPQVLYVDYSWMQNLSSGTEFGIL